jgi:hypothetical protein
MATNPPTGRGRMVWGLVVAAVVVLFGLVLIFGMLSEREDAQVLPGEEMESMEQPYQAEP